MKTGDQITYRDCTTVIEFNPEEDIFFGKIHDIEDHIVFHAENPKELAKSFRNAVDTYLNSMKSS